MGLAERREREKEEQKKRRREEILEAARTLIRTKGFAGSTMEDVAREAELSPAALYLYFKNKDELFITVASEGLEILQGWLEELDIENDSLESLIRQTMDTYLRFATDRADYFRIIFSEASAEMIANVPEALRVRVAQQERDCLAVVARIVEKGLAEGALPPSDPWEMAVIYWGTCTGILLLSFGASQTIVGQQVREELISKAVWILYRGSTLDPPDASRRPWSEEG